MRRAAIVGLVVLGACGDNLEPLGSDAPAPPPDDPFAGAFDEPSEFPRERCRPGSMAGFARSELYFDVGLRTEARGALSMYVRHGFHHERRVPYTLDADDLLVRYSEWSGVRWSLTAIDICAADADGTIHGAMAECYEELIELGFPCRAYPFSAAPFRRFTGEPEASHLGLLGELGAAWPGASSNVRVDGDVAVVSRFEDGLRIVSVADPTAPVELAHFVAPEGEYANDLKLVRTGGRLYAIVASVQAYVVELTDPRQPRLVARIPSSPHSVALEGLTAYLVDGTSGLLDIWSLADPRAPVRLGAWQAEPVGLRTPAWHDVHVANGIAYLSDISGTGLHVVDVRDPTAPRRLGGETGSFGPLWHSPWLTTVGGRHVAIHGTEFSAELGMRLLDGDPASPTFLAPLGEWSLGRGSAHNLMAIGSRVYLAHYRDGVRVVDIADPAAPVPLGHFHTWPVDNAGATAGELGAYGLDLDPARRRIYVADSIRGLVILEGDATIFPLGP